MRTSSQKELGVPVRLQESQQDTLLGVLARERGPQATHPALTQSEASVELQVGREEASQAGENLAARLPTVDLIAAVDQAVGGAPVVRFVQHSAKQLPGPDDHLWMDGHQCWAGGDAPCGSLPHLSEFY